MPIQKKPVPVIITALEDPKLADDAIKTLCSFGPAAKDAIPAIGRAIRYRHAHEKEQDIKTYNLIGDLTELGAVAVPLLIEFLQDKDLDLDCQDQSARVLREIGPAAKEAVPALTNLLQHDDLLIRMVAANALWIIDKNAAGLPAAMALLKEGVNGQARQVMRRFGSGPFGFLVIGYSMSDRWAAAAAGVLEDFGPAAKSALPDLEKGLAHEDPDFRSCMMDTIEKIDPEQSRQIKERQKAEAPKEKPGGYPGTP